MIEALTQGVGYDVTASRERAEVNREDFLQILVSELTNQNPMDPMDNTAFLQQLVGLQTLEQTSALTDALKTFERFMQMSSASGLIGKSVKAITTAGDPIDGEVQKVTMKNGNVNLVVNGFFVPFQGVQEIKDPAASGDNPTSNS